MLKIIAFLLLLFPTSSCSNNEVTDSPVPENLTVEVQADSENPKKFIIQATAENVIEYDFRMAGDEEALEKNTSGRFEYTFTSGGKKKIEVRAYGEIGVFLKEIKEISVPGEEEEEEEPIVPGEGYSTPLNYEGYELMWNDEFDGNTVNSENWTFEIGDGCPNICGWGNNELQYYREQNAWVEEGILTIEARKESVGGKRYTSARMKTQGKKSFQYGRIDIRALLPEGQGIWPALWMLGDNITSVGWPACGEIDIMEMIGGNQRENTVHGTLHWDINGHADAGNDYTLSSGTFADGYHVFSIIWNENTMRWFVNDVEYGVIDISPSHMSEFHNSFFFIFNIAVGGNWPGNPDNDTVFPQQMKVDYIRVFQPVGNN